VQLQKRQQLFLPHPFYHNIIYVVKIFKCFGYDKAGLINLSKVCLYGLVFRGLQTTARGSTTKDYWFAWLFTELPCLLLYYKVVY